MAVMNVRQRKRQQRRGVASILAMMFLVIFSALAAAMAVVAQGNLRTAESGLKLSRAMSAAETGLVFAQKRLAQESARFVVEKGVIDGDFGEDIWMGSVDQSADGAVTVLDPTGYVETTPATGVAEAVANAHAADEHSFNQYVGDENLPAIDPLYGTIDCKPIRLSADANAAFFRLKYELVNDEPLVRVTSIGTDGDITRTLQMDFVIEKKIEFAVLSPNRIMIGKNVLIEGPLGSRYGVVAGELDSPNGDPLVMRSDFHYLDPTLDARLDTLYAQVTDYDVDGDARLRPDHPVEGGGVDGFADLVDYDEDEYVDDFDLFLDFYDADLDLKVVYDATKATAAGLPGLSNEFSGIDDQLARLIDRGNADRDADGDVDDTDTRLGYDDGVLDVNDIYAKVRGREAFAVARSPWDTANAASYQTIVQGPVRSDLEVSPAGFEVTDEEMREVTTDMFSGSQTWFAAQAAAGQPFGDTATGQVAANIATGGTYTAPSTWEEVPFGSTGPYDYFQRPTYENMTFTDVVIPKGTNGLFKNCTFVGVTYIETEEDCDDVNWNLAGAVEKVESPPGSGTFIYPVKFPSITATIGTTPVADTRPESNNIRFENCTFLGSIAGDKPSEYTHWRNKLQMTGNTRFYLDPDDEDLAEQDDAATLIALLNGLSSTETDELAKSSILMPGWSIDVGNFTNEQGATPDDTAKVKLKGTIIAGILDVRGTADVHGTLLMTFRPVTGAGPLFYGALPDAFNTTVGYFGPLDGDFEGVDADDAAFTGYGEITLRYDPDAKLPDGIPWPIRIVAEPTTYSE